jgi:nitroreductase
LTFKSPFKLDEMSMMDAFDCVATKLDVREFDAKAVPAEVKLKVLEAGRLTGSGMNVQHWRFILVQGQDNLRKLAQDSTTGKWVENANFAVIILTNPKYGFHLIDSGRAAQDMQVAAWNYEVASCLFTGVDRDALHKDFEIPKEMNASMVIGFGYPTTRISGRKSRKPLKELVYLDRYGKILDQEKLGA